MDGVAVIEPHLDHIIDRLDVEEGISMSKPNALNEHAAPALDRLLSPLLAPSRSRP